MIDPSYVNIYRKQTNSLKSVDYINDAQRLMIYINSNNDLYKPLQFSTDSSFTQIYTEEISQDIAYKFINDSKILTTYSNSIQITGISYEAPPI